MKGAQGQGLPYPSAVFNRAVAGLSFYRRPLKPLLPYAPPSPLRLNGSTNRATDSRCPCPPLPWNPAPQILRSIAPKTEGWRDRPAVRTTCMLTSEWMGPQESQLFARLSQSPQKGLKSNSGGAHLGPPDLRG